MRGPGIAAGLNLPIVGSFADVAPTILDLAGADAKVGAAMDGNSFAPWLLGKSPYTCNVANVAFVEAAAPEPSDSGADRFRIFFGGADAVVGTAVVEVSAA